MKPTRKISRRSFLGRVAGGAIAGGAAMTVLGEAALARAELCGRQLLAHRQPDPESGLRAWPTLRAVPSALVHVPWPRNA